MDSNHLRALSAAPTISGNSRLPSAAGFKWYGSCEDGLGRSSPATRKMSWEPLVILNLGDRPFFDGRAQR